MSRHFTYEEDPEMNPFRVDPFRTGRRSTTNPDESVPIPPIMGESYTQLQHRADYWYGERNRYKDVAAELEAALTETTATLQETDKALQHVLRATGGTVPEFQVQDRFTICMLADAVAGKVFSGAALCNVQDKFDRSIGEAISYGRAAAARADYYAERAFGR